MDICQIGYDICEFDSLRGLGIDVIGRVHFDNRDRFAIWMGNIGDRTMSTNEWLLTSDFWQFLEPWHGRWYEYEIFIASCTDNIYDLENERWLLGDMIDHVGIYGSRVVEGLSAFYVGLVISCSSLCFSELFSVVELCISTNMPGCYHNWTDIGPILAYLHSFKLVCRTCLCWQYFNWSTFLYTPTTPSANRTQLLWTQVPGDTTNFLICSTQNL